MEGVLLTKSVLTSKAFFLIGKMLLVVSHRVCPVLFVIFINDVPDEVKKITVNSLWMTLNYTKWFAARLIKLN